MTYSTNYQLRATNYGFTLLEVIIVTFIIGTAVAGLFGLFLMTLRSAQVGERRIVAVALANEKMELIRNLPYANVGTAGGVPAGTLAQEETITRNNQTYTVRTDIRYVDDLYDGDADGIQEEEERVIICHQPGTSAEKTLEVSASALDAHIGHGDTTGACGEQGEGTPEGDEYNVDYKQVRVEVSWPSQDQISPVLLITYIAPQGIEGGELGGTLDFHAFDAAGAAIVGATVELTNDEVDPAINMTTQTNEEGHVVLPGLPPASDSYHVAVTKAGFTTEQTYPLTATFAPLPDYSAFSLVAEEVTSKTFFIDVLSTLTITTQDEEEAALGNIAYHLRGTKSIGQNATGGIVYKVDEEAVTAANGQNSHTTLDWDAYDITMNGAVTGYDIKETSIPLPVTIAPGEEKELTVVLAPHTDNSVQVTIVDGTGAPVDNATVALEGAGSLVTGVWGQVFFSGLSGGAQLQLNVSAPGFIPQQQTVGGTGTVRARIELTPQD